jgi:hypothetical protein
MVAINKVKDNIQFEVLGLHKLWAFKSQITVPQSNIVSVQQVEGPLSIFKGLKMPGTHLPSVIAAGTYFKGGKKSFWDVVNSKNCIVVELKDSNYDQLVIEVTNPDEAIKMLRH